MAKRKQADFGITADMVFKAVATVLSGAVTCSYFNRDCTRSVRVTRKTYKRGRNSLGPVEMVMRVGRLNFAERQYRIKFKKKNHKLPVFYIKQEAWAKAGRAYAQDTWAMDKKVLQIMKDLYRNNRISPKAGQVARKAGTDSVKALGAMERVAEKFRKWVRTTRG